MKRIFCILKTNFPNLLFIDINIYINNCLQKISSNQNIFKETTQHYQEEQVDMITS